MRIGTLATLLAGAIALGGCSGAETFAQYPGFAEWFAAHPPNPEPADAAGRALLQRYRPRLYVPAGASGPLDFYRDYIAHGTLYADGRHWSHVDRTLLAAHMREPDAVFVHHRPADPEPHAVGYGRVTRADIPGIGRVTFLGWDFAFRYSGLPADLPAWAEWLAGTFGDPADWHQLDHYTTAVLALGPGHTPLGLILQQHNWQRAYWFGRDLAWPADGHVRLTAAVRSNELYPWSPGSARHRVVRFLEADNVDWLATGHGDAPRTAARDVTRPGTRVRYDLRFLPGTDPFYRFQGRLGADRLLPGRDGPPGADYDAIPAFKDRAFQLCAFHWEATMAPAALAPLRAVLAHPRDGDARARLMARCKRFMAGRVGRFGYNAALADRDRNASR